MGGDSILLRRRCFLCVSENRCVCVCVYVCVCMLCILKVCQDRLCNLVEVGQIFYQLVYRHQSNTFFIANLEEFA